MKSRDENNRAGSLLVILEHIAVLNNSSNYALIAFNGNLDRALKKDFKQWLGYCFNVDCRGRQSMEILVIIMLSITTKINEVY